MNKTDDMVSVSLVQKLLNRESKHSTLKKILILLGLLVVIAAVAYAVYKFFAPDYTDDFDDEFDDEFDDDFFEDDEEEDAEK